MDLRQYGANTPLRTLKGWKGTCRIVDIYDGDSLQAVLDDRGVAVRVNCRVAGVDTCELRSKSEEGLRFALEARIRLISMITKQPVEMFADMSRSDFRDYLDSDLYTVELVCGADDKYGRTLTKMYLDDSQETLGHKLIEEGMAVEYNGGTKMSEASMVHNMQKRRDDRRDCL